MATGRQDAGAPFTKEIQRISKLDKVQALIKEGKKANEAACLVGYTSHGTRIIATTLTPNQRSFSPGQEK